jgi:hypothetical protein
MKGLKNIPRRLLSDAGQFEAFWRQAVGSNLH